MRLSVIGCGYLGAVHAAAMASLGHDVIGVDTDVAKVDALAAGQAPFYEPGLPELLAEAGSSGRLRFTTKLSEVSTADVHFICVGTPQRDDGYGADLTFVESAVTELLPHLARGAVVVGKSTVPVGTAARLEEAIADVQPSAQLVWNPEFLREGLAVQDTLHPDRIVYGLPEERRPGANPAAAEARVDEVYATPLNEGIPKMVTDYATAELVKVAANSFLATKISFINAMAELCEATGADVTSLADAIGMDERIGRKFLNAGVGFGGGCLPKDIRAFMHRAGELGADQALSFLREVDAINMRRRSRVVDIVRTELEGSVEGKRIAVLGAAFKPNSDDVRDSPALAVAAQLHLEGAEVVVTDPQANGNAAAVWPTLSFAESPEEAAHGAEMVVLLTEWKQFRDLDPQQLGGVVANRRMVDGRNVLAPDSWRTAGWAYRSLGRP